MFLKNPRWFLLLACGILILLWFPGLTYPIVSDTSLYALLGESFWTEGRYAVLGEAHGKHLLLHSITSYLFVAPFGYHVGMKMASLTAGFGVLVLSYFFLRRIFGEGIALLGTVTVLFHHGFIIMTVLGSADLLFTVLFLSSLLTYLHAETDKRWYIATGVLIGLATLTRYNGYTLYPALFLFTLWKRREDFRSRHLWIGIVSAVILSSTWFVYRLATFGTLSNEYTEELSARTAGFLAQMPISAAYYIDPTKNILPILLIFSIVGMFVWKKQRAFLLLPMVCMWGLLLIWPVLIMRYAFPTYPLLIGFAFAGIAFLINRFPTHKTAIVSLLTIGIVATHGAAICLYDYGECNAWFDRTHTEWLGRRFIPADMGLTSEGFWMWHRAREFLNAHAPENAPIIVEEGVKRVISAKGVFRDDLRFVSGVEEECPAYVIARDDIEGEILFSTEQAPVTRVVLQECP